MRTAGYRVDFKVLRAADFGVPTSRERLFIVARRDGLPVVWPTPTHGAVDALPVRQGHRLPWRSAAEIIDWSLPTYSVFITAEQAKSLGLNDL